MIVNKLKMDLNRCAVAPTVDAVQGDSCSRILEISLHASGKPFLLPKNSAVLIRYKKADGKGGEYDTLPDGSSAWSAQGNTLKLTLAPQVLTCSGNVFMTVILISEGKQLSTFPLRIMVQPSAQPFLPDSEDYFKITGFLKAPSNAKAGQYLQIASVDASGKATEITATDILFPETEDAPADWNASEGEPGHILNRPFYSTYENVTVLETVTLTATEETDGIGVLPDPLDLHDGMVCIVTYNGTAYECTAVEDTMEGTPCFMLGNIGFIDLDYEDTGEPFALMCFPAEVSAMFGAGGIVMPLDGSETITLSITGKKETIYPLPSRYLGNLKGQKSIVIDLDSESASCSSYDVADMDSGELQSAISVIYNGIRHAAIIVSREEFTFNDMSYHCVVLLVAHGLDTGSVFFTRCTWNGLNVYRNQQQYMLPFSNDGIPDRVISLVQLPGEPNPSWRPVTQTPLDGIVLKSTSSNSAKKFLITVDDNGTLSAKEIYL